VTDVTATTDAASTVTTPSVDPALVLRVTERLALDGNPPSATAVAAAARAEGVVLGAASLQALVIDVRAELTGLGPLQPLLDGDVSDVLVNAPDEVWVDRGSGLQRVPVRFQDEAAVRRLAQRLAASAGRRLDVGRPSVDARLAGGVRLHAVVPPLSPSGTLISLRVLRRKTFGLEELVECGTVLPELAGLLEVLVLSRASFLVTGGTGSGKTTVLAALLSVVPAAERVVLVEDAGELAPDHPHVLRLEARTANVEGAGAIDLRSLVREALRMRPDRIVVGEVRGAEVVELLAALNTGHDGGAGTLHASSASTVPARLEVLGLAAGLPRAAVHSQVAVGLQAVVHLERVRGGRRVVREVGCFERGSDGLCSVATAVRTEGDRLVEGPGAELLSAALSGPR
jgi:pilus assembly protein CpaF